MNKRQFLRCLPAGLLLGTTLPALARPAPHTTTATTTLLAAWRSPLQLSPAGATLGASAPTDYIGRLEADWDAGRIHIRQALPIPGRVHGLLPGREHSYYAIATRPGAWLLHVDGDGQLLRQRQLDDEAKTGARSLDGHASLSPDGAWLLTSETDPATGQGWIGIRDARTLKKEAEWRSHGIEPHALQFIDQNRLLIANGGLLRGPRDKKRNLEQMDSSLVLLNPGSGERLGQWRLPDPRLSLRHLALATPAAGQQDTPLRAGIALQAEHDDPQRRQAAPILAVWDGERLGIPSHMPVGQGYCSDISPGPNGGFYLNGERVHRAFYWDPARPGELATIAEHERSGALARWSATPDQDAAPGVLIGTAHGLVGWHPAHPERQLPWPIAMALDNHWHADKLASS